jgi:hypothetical protein
MEPTKREEKTRLGSFPKKVIALTLTLAAVSFAALFGTVHAQASDREQKPRVILPLVQCWYKGKVAYYIQTEASDAALAQQQDVNYVPLLANVLSASPTAVDDIYHVTNFTQGNVIPSAPIPAGPGNKDPNYSPLWQVSLVTWNQGTDPYTLKSEEEIKKAEADGLVTIVKTNIVVNCPVIYTPYGGLLPKAKIIGGHTENDE